ncbi:hypothetical protein MIND_00446700 [Mycena indigotica]|uniref:Uncharacterized protein n=1 Tax=Mycena indigotica TaxID=2126181 RepID=A0A8H6W5I0_9AGAR|nr:uncharacterized protein MIND_00446700 [Mycena indigotica]KAF7306554.1 hypothetical protein MIND_00446700 [Mycena indigotica]
MEAGRFTKLGPSASSPSLFHDARLPSPPQSPFPPTMHPNSTPPQRSPIYDDEDASELGPSVSRRLSDSKRKVSPANPDQPSLTTKKPRIYSLEDDQRRKTIADQASRITTLEGRLSKYESELSNLRTCLKAQLDRVEEQETLIRQLEEDNEGKDLVICETEQQLAESRSRTETAEQKARGLEEHTVQLKAEYKTFSINAKQHYRARIDYWKAQCSALKSSSDDASPLTPPDEDGL